MSTPGYDPSAPDWDAPLPSHRDAVMDGYGGGQPSVAEQARTHGAYLIPGGVPAVDKGPQPRTVVG